MSTYPLAVPYVETLGKRAQALLFAAGIHLLALLLMYAGVLFSSESTPQPLAGEPIEAELIDLPKGPPPRPVRVTPKPEQIKPVAAPPPKPEPAANLDDVTDIKPVPMVAEPDPLAVAAEAEKARQRRLEEERRIQLSEIREQRDAAEKERLKLEQELKQQQEQTRSMEQLLADRTSPTTQERPEIAEQESALRGDVDTDDLAAQWQSALVNHIRAYWRTDGKTPDGLRCNVRINTIPGGEVVSSLVIAPCAFDDALRQSLQDAIRAASPLPYNGFEKVAQRSFTMTFDTTFIE